MIFDDNIIFAQSFFKVSSGNRYYRIPASHRWATPYLRHRRKILRTKKPPLPFLAMAAFKCAAWRS